MESNLKTHSQQPRIEGNSDEPSSQQTNLNEENSRNETGVVCELNGKRVSASANELVSSSDERGIVGVADSFDLNPLHVCSSGLVAIADSYSCSDDETSLENAAGFINLKIANAEEECGEDVENNNSVHARAISLSEDDTSCKKQEGSLNLENLEDVQSKIIEVKNMGCTLKSPGKDSHTLGKPVNDGETSVQVANIGQVTEPAHDGHIPITSNAVDTGHKKELVNVRLSIKEPMNVGHTSTKCLNATSPLVDSDTTHQVYVMSNIDKELEIICKEKSTTKMDKSEEEDNSSSDESSSDSDDESSSSETSTSSDTSSEDDLEDIRKEIEREEEKVQTGPPKTRSEVLIKDLPEVPDLDINIADTAQLVELGLVFSIVESIVVVKAFPQTPALDSESILFLENRSCLGLVFETFGPVQTPFYSVRFNRESEISTKNVQVGHKVFYAPDIMEYSHYVFVTQLKKLKGSDASWEHDEEPPQEAIEYSDDEEEAKVKASRKKERIGKSGSTDKLNPQKTEGTETAQHQGTSKGNRKRSWQNRAKGQPSNHNQNDSQGTPHQSNPVPSPHPAYRGPDTWHGGTFSLHAPRGPFLDHPAPEALHFGVRPMAPPRGMPHSRLPLGGPPPRVPFGMVPGPTTQFSATQPTHLPNPPRLPYESPRPLTGGPAYQGPWPVGPPGGFVPRPPIPQPQGLHDPGFQGQNFMGMPPPPPPPPHNL